MSKDKSQTGPIKTIKTAQELRVVPRSIAMELSSKTTKAGFYNPEETVDGFTATQSVHALTVEQEQFVSGQGEYPFYQKDGDIERWGYHPEVALMALGLQKH